MGIGPWLIAGAAVGGAVLYFRRTSSAAPSTSTGSVCDRIRALNPQAGAACDAASGLLGGIAGAYDAIFTDNAEMEATNLKLNGEVVRAMPAAMPYAYVGLQADQGGGFERATRTRTIEHANGCTPYRGSRGWSKCAPGTEDMRARDGSTYMENAPTSGVPWGSGSHGGGDPFVLADKAARESPGARADRASPPPFPLPVPSGSTAWWVDAAPVVCPAGTGISGSGVRDHRPGASPCRPLSADHDPVFPPPDQTRICNPGESYSRRTDHTVSPAVTVYTPCRPASTGTVVFNQSTKG